MISVYLLKSSDAIVPGRGQNMIPFLAIYLFESNFQSSYWEMASTISNPSIIIVSHLRDGSVVTVGDYQAAYWWFRDTTPEDARDLS